MLKHNRNKSMIALQRDKVLKSILQDQTF